MTTTTKLIEAGPIPVFDVVAFDKFLSEDTPKPEWLILSQGAYAALTAPDVRALILYYDNQDAWKAFASWYNSHPHAKKIRWDRLSMVNKNIAASLWALKHGLPPLEQGRNSFGKEMASAQESHADARQAQS